MIQQFKIWYASLNQYRIHNMLKYLKIIIFFHTCIIIIFNINSNASTVLTYIHFYNANGIHCIIKRKEKRKAICLNVHKNTTSHMKNYNNRCFFKLFCEADASICLHLYSKNELPVLQRPLHGTVIDFGRHFDRTTLQSTHQPCNAQWFSFPASVVQALCRLRVELMEN